MAVKSQRYLVDSLIPRWGIGVLWGPPSSLKTFWALDIAGHIAIGREYQGSKVDQGGVVYCPFEGSYGMINRLDALKIALGIDDMPDNFRLLADPLRFEKIPSAGHRRLIGSIKELDYTPHLVVLDTLHRSLVGSENSDEDMGFYINAASEIASVFECFVLIIHHTGKMSPDLRGHSSLRGDADLLLGVNRQGEKGTSSDMVSVRVEKMKDGPEGTTVHSWVCIADMGVDDYGRELSSCYLKPAPPPPDMPKGLKGKGQVSKAYAILERLIMESDNSCTTREAWKEECIRTKLAKGTLVAQKKAFDRAYDDLRERGVISVNGPVVTIVEVET